MQRDGITIPKFANNANKRYKAEKRERIERTRFYIGSVGVFIAMLLVMVLDAL